MSQGNAKGSGGGNSSYAPAIPSNWETVPSTTTQALDEIAANVPLNYVISRPPLFSVDQASLSLSVNSLFKKATNFYFDSVSGLVWVADAGSGILHAIDTNFNLVSSVDLSTYADATSKIKANATYLLVSHTDGILNGNYILIINKTTKALVGILDAVGSANDFAIDGTGQVWAVDTGNQIVRLFTTGDIASAISGFPTPQSASGGTFLGTSQPNCICYDSVDNQIWVGTLGHATNEQLYQMDTSGTVLNTYDATGLTSFSAFMSLVYYNGFVWCGTNAPSILQVDPTTFTTGSGTDGGAVVELDISGSTSLNINIDTFTTSVLVGSNNGKVYRVNAVTSPTLSSTITVSATGNTNGIGITGPRLLASVRQKYVYSYTDIVGGETLQGLYSGPVQSMDWNAVVAVDGGASIPNIRSNRGLNQSAVDGTKQGITNFGSDTTGGGNAGATEIFTTISGGDQNNVSDQYSNISGGLGNTINTGGTFSAISGGSGNAISADHGTISGGNGNSVSAAYGAIGGGCIQTLSGFAGTIAGGYQNTATGSFTPIVIGGQSCASGGNHSISGGYYALATANDAIALGFNNAANGVSSISLGYSTLASRFGQLSLSSAGGNIIGAPVAGTSSGDAQNGNVVFGTKQTTPGTSFVLTDAAATPSEFHLLNDVTGHNQYYMITITMVLYADNAAVGPVASEYKVMAHVAGGLAVIDHQAELLVQIGFPNDPNTTGWLTSISVDGTTDILHINVDPNGDSTNTINASADIRWVEVSGFAQ